jgi:predicted RNase H-like HicB family nuclease
MRQTLTYTVNIEQKDDGGFAARVPVLPECRGEGRSLEETVISIQTAITRLVESLLDHDELVPVEREPSQALSLPITIEVTVDPAKPLRKLTRP